MNFLSDHFLLFLPIALALWYGTRGYARLRTALMIVASLFFYADDFWWFVPIILAYCLVDWATGLALAKRPNRAILAAGVGFNLAVLSFWKYTPLLLHTFAETLGVPSVDAARVLETGWIVPLGVSFYAFSGIAYMVDVHQRRTEPERDLLRYTLFTTFFPHLVAGPILRAREFLVDLRPERLPMRPDGVWEGAFLIARGAFKKTVLGDGIAVAIDPYFAHVGDPTTAGVWALPYLYLYALQIYFDFSGYTDIARGLGLWFGFRWPENFDRPYLAASVQDFWRRWHMTLSRFLRDYLYIPLGGSRNGLARTTAATMVTMMLGGLWHGASWSFMVWGGLHGLYLVAHLFWARTAAARWLAAHGGLPWRLVAVALTFNVVCLAWAFFRVTDFNQAIACLSAVFTFAPDRAMAGGSADLTLWLMLALYGAAALTLDTRYGRDGLQAFEQSAWRIGMGSGLIWGATAGVGVLAWLIAPSGMVQPFIYFQF